MLCVLLNKTSFLNFFPLFDRYGNHTKNYIVRVGDYHTLVSEEYEQVLEVKNIIIHKDYKPDANDYDIALVKLEGDQEQCIKLNAHVLPACLPHRRERTPRKGSNCYITGWGDTGNNEYYALVSQMLNELGE